MRKTRKKKAYMYMRIGLWASLAECNQKIAEVKQFLESNGYEYDVNKGNVVIDMNDEQFNGRRFRQRARREFLKESCVLGELSDFEGAESDGDVLPSGAVGV